MARIRSIHPGIHTDERYAAISHAAFRLYVGILGEADDFGAFEASVIQMKMRILPAHNDDVANLLAELQAADIVRVYEHEGRQMGVVRNFTRYQSPKRPTSRHFIPPEYRTYVGIAAPSSVPDDVKGAESTVPDLLETGASTVPEAVKEGAVPKKEGESPQIGEEGKGKEESSLRSPKKNPDDGSARRGSRLPDDFDPDLAVGVAEGLDLVATKREVARFCDYWRGVPGAKGRKADWPATWRNWVRKVVDDRTASHTRRNGGTTGPPGNLLTPPGYDGVDEQGKGFRWEDRAKFAVRYGWKPEWGVFPDDVPPGKRGLFKGMQT